ncbi:MAG: EAL domain-containing protein [Nitrosomonadales bacterium]|nr:EAL domain-containing protein [Nitrosomonadales bacterium]
MIHRWWQSLNIQFKLTLLIQMGLIAILIPAQGWLMSSFEEKIRESAKSRATEAADGIINGMNMLMVTGQISDPQNRMLFINKMGQSQGILELRIFRAEQVKKQFGPGLPQEQPTDEIDRKVLDTGNPYFGQDAQTRSLRAVIPFIVSRNFRGTDCLACHKVEVGSVNGAASIVLDLSKDTDMIRAINRWLWLGQAALQIVLYLVINLVVRSFTRPVRRLQRVMTAMQADGDLSRRVSINSKDEIGQMAIAFNALADSLQKNVTQVRKGEEQLKLSAQVFVSSMEAIVITDAGNNIIQVNKAFTEITGYSPEEVIGKNPRVLKSGRHDQEFYRDMWDALLRTGSWQGEVMDRRKSGEIYPKWLAISVVRDGAGAIRNYIALFSDITERKASYERIQYLAHFDALTHLPNRTLLNDRVELAIAGAKRDQRRLAVIFLDLDRFKNVNDSLGHHVGDLLLQAVAERLKNCVRESDTISRLGGDEFVVLLNGILDQNDAVNVAQKVLNTLSNPFDLEGHEVRIGASLGISIYPDNGPDSSELFKNADAAMYDAKKNGRNNFRLFSTPMNNETLEQISLENDLWRALKNKEFILHYQPQIDILTGKVIGAEALIRWQHPDKGLIPPVRFIPIAEENGLIAPIGEWVLNEACAQNKKWQDEGLIKIPVAVNLSALQFHQKNIKETIACALHDSGLEPGYLELEITESVTMKEVETTVRTLNEIKLMGVLISIDDFGTGYSSLSYLKRFPIDKLKVDRSFVRDLISDPDDAAIVRSIIGMGHGLRLKVIAEGVETAEQLAFLRESRCDEIQGYYFSHPLGAQDFAAFVEETDYGAAGGGNFKRAPTHQAIRNKE